ncbi:MAG: glycosyltransferase family 39 protein [Vicinamibacterales bacterium]
MTMLRGKALVVVALIAGLAAASVYATRLGYAPIYLTHDEVNFSLQAISIAETGRDLNGRWFPVYFSEPEFTAGRDPMMIYVTALALTVLPLSDAAVRLPTALVGVVTIVLLLVLWSRISPRPWMPVVAAMCLCCSPGWFIHSRLALSVIYPLPFVVIWLLAVRQYELQPRPIWLLAGCASLALGIYGYLAGLVMMPIYVLMTVWMAKAWRSPRLLLAIAAGFGIVLLPIAIWHVFHPERYAELLHAYRMDAPRQAGLPPLLSLDGARTRLGAWWQYFNPDFLFLAGDTSLTNSTRTAGLFPAAFVVLLPVGMIRLARGSRFERIVLLGLLTGPVAAIATGTIDLNRYRALFVLPFGAMVAAYGFEAWWASPRLLKRAAAGLLLISLPLHFHTFYRDYMDRYRDASAVWFGEDLRGALAEVFQRRAPGEPLLVSRGVPYAGVYARFYSQVHNPGASPDVPTVVDGETFDGRAAHPHSWLIAAADERWLSRLSPAEWDRVALTKEPSGEVSFAVYHRRAP